MKKVLFVFILLFSLNCWSQNQLTRVLFILDASNSMHERWEGVERIVTAKKVLIDAVKGLKGVPNLEIALRVYGHQYQVTSTYQNCNDTKLEVPFKKDNIRSVINKIQLVEAKGTTPIALSLEAAAGDFPDKNSRNIIVLITDGKEECGGDPCVIARKLKDKGISVSPFVIGLGLDLSYLDYFNCIGNYKAANTPNTFKKVLDEIVDEILYNTTAQINLNTKDGRPIETDVSMFLYKAGTNELKYTFTHTMNRLDLPDTLVINPDTKYDLYVETLPVTIKKNITLKRNIHNIIEVDVPQGALKVRFKSPTKYNYVDVRVMEDKKHQTLNVQKTGKQKRYIIGTYQLEILTLPRRYKTVSIKQSELTTVNIEAPGVITFLSFDYVTGQIFEKKTNNKFQWVCNLNEQSKENKFVLQPGDYQLVYRIKNLTETTYTRVINFSIYSNDLNTIRL